MSEISLRNVSKIYGDAFAAVKDVSLDIADGEFVILVGPSGCGKSTLLRMIVGLEDISEGELDIGGERMNNKAPKDRNLAMVFQNYALYPHLSVRENVAFPLTLAKMDEKTIHDKVEEAAKTLELTEHLDRKPGQLSGGQRQRVAMGRRSCVSRTLSCSTNRCPTSTRSSAARCGPRSRGCRSASVPPRCTSPTTRPKP